MSITKPRPTLKDIAKLANCSTAVVSTVINKARGNTVVSDEVRRRVEEVARNLGYQPNFASQSLVRQQTNTLGIYIPPQPWAGPGYAYDNAVLRGIEAGCRANDYDLLIINFSGEEGPEACIQKFARRRIDGVVLVHAELDSPWIAPLTRVTRNVVAVDFPEARALMDVVSFDNLAVSEVAVEHLVKLGHTRIGFLGSCREPVSVDGDIRRVGFLQAMARRGLPVDPAWVFTADKIATPLRPEDPVCQTEGCLGGAYFHDLHQNRPTAVLAYGDLPALHAIQTLMARGLRVPQDISFVGVDDSEWSRLVRPYITSVAKPLEDMGRRAVELLIGHSRDANGRIPAKPAGGTHEVFTPTLVSRDSTAAPAATVTSAATV
ncbi:MAG: LacI family DNA-binding transcriptional regulator [Phycisphaerae bacterium]